VIIGMDGEAEARDARRQQVIKKIGSGSGEEKASGHIPGKGTHGQPSLHGVEVSRPHAKALGAEIIGDGGCQARLHRREHRLQRSAFLGRTREPEAKPIPGVIPSTPLLRSGIKL
jgi:hypothetical protein